MEPLEIENPHALVARKSPCSHEGNKWGLKQDASRVSQEQTAQLLLAFQQRRRRKLEVSIDLPFP